MSPEELITNGETILEHFGVKGMKWGVRRADKKFEKKASSTKVFMQVYDGAAKAYNKHDIARINNSPKYRNKDFSQPSKLRDQYYKEHREALVKRLEESAASMTNKSGTRRYTVVVNADNSWDVETTDIKHADDTIRVSVTYDAKGYITAVSLPEVLEQSGLDSDVALEHFGVKGMKWGVRRQQNEANAAEDHKVTASVREKAKSGGGTKALSNQELQAAITRMNLEDQYSNLVAKRRKIRKGIELVKAITGAVKTGQDAYNTGSGLAGNIKKVSSS
jgi:hypothetical protein